MKRRSPLLALFALALLGAPATASDWWVDPILGNDMASGTSPGMAWKTISHAVTAIPAGTQVVHLVPGTYDAASGEQFPIQVEGDVTLVGEGPRASVVVTGSGTLFTIGSIIDASFATLRSLTLADASQAVYATAWGFNGAPRVRLEDVQVRDCTFGVRLDVSEAVITRVEAFGVEFLRCGTGVSSVSAAVGDPSFAFADCAFLEGGRGVHIIRQFDDYGDVEFDRCELRDQTGTAVELSSNNSNTGSDVDMRDTLVVDAARGVVCGDNNDLALVRSTVANHTNEGVATGCPTLLRGCILYGNGDDLAAIGITPTLVSCCIGDGDGSGAGGNISVDPLFRAPDQGDYRLGWGTGCVDAIAGSSGLDLSGFERGNDGDLDLVGAADMGAFELRTLETPATLAIGQKLHIDYHAEVGSFGVLYLVRTNQLPAPLATPFGEQWLPPQFLELIAMQKSLTPAPMRRTIFIPNSPALIGQPFSFQALSRSSSAPQGAAWTDPATVVFTL